MSDNPYAIMGAVVKVVTDTLTDDELAAINLAAQLGMDPRNAMGYDKATSLFTEANGTQMHDVTRGILASITLARLAPEQSA